MNIDTHPDLLELLRTYERTQSNESLAAFMTALHRDWPSIDKPFRNKISTEFRRVTGWELKFEDNK